MARNTSCQSWTALDHGARLGGGVGPQPRFVAVGADPERHDAQRGQLGEPVEHAGQGVVEHGAVVAARAHHHLAVDLDAVVEQGAEPPQARRPAPVAQHGGADLGVGGVDGHVQRRQALEQHPLEVELGEAGEGW